MKLLPIYSTNIINSQKINSVENKAIGVIYLETYEKTITQKLIV